MDSLLKSWETFLQKIRAQKDLLEKYVEFKGLLVAEYKYRCMDNQGNSNSKRIAMQAKQYPPRFSGVCDNCGKKGHKKADCWAKNSSKKAKDPTRDRNESQMNTKQTKSLETETTCLLYQEQMESLCQKWDQGLDHGYWIQEQATTNGMSVILRGKVILCANKVKEGPYTLETKKSGLATTVKEIRTITAEEAHQSMGYLNEKDVQKLNELADSIKISEEKLRDCKICTEAKITRHVNKERLAKTEAAGEKLSMDLTFVNNTPILLVSDTRSSCTLAKSLEKKSGT
ncbi:hypothetical protein HDU80_005212 [Chytriomyces hyalinus]|nr:hypothetical protein HDU80_005212 [Chytriomyces hyalinus]